MPDKQSKTMTDALLLGSAYYNVYVKFCNQNSIHRYWL